jgi:hypothetical protein
MLKPQRVNFDELSERLRVCEQEYGYSTIQFYRCFRDGEPGDDNDQMLWASLYHLYLTSLSVRRPFIQPM